MKPAGDSGFFHAQKRWPHGSTNPFEIPAREKGRTNMSKTETDTAVEEMIGSPAAENSEATEEVTESAQETTEAAASENTDESESAQTEESDGTDWKAESRKWEGRAKENKEKADAHDALSTKVSELEADKEKVTNDLTAVQRENLVLRLRLKHNVSEDDANLFLTASDEETLEKQAERLSRNSAHAPKPDAAQGTRNNSGPLSAKQQGAAALEELLLN